MNAHNNNGLSGPHSQYGHINDTQWENHLRRKLKYFFMNPCDKFTAKRRFPWKLSVQLIKIVLVTIQLALFGFSRSSHVDFLEKSNIAFRHLYLQNWNAGYETMPYPPATGVFAIYTIPEFYDSVNYAMRRYNETERIAVGTYHFNHPNDTKPPMYMCKKHYRKGKIYAYNHTYIFDAKTVEECFQIAEVNRTNHTTGESYLEYDIERYLKSINESINFDRIIQIYLKFAVTTIHIKTLTSVNTPDCYVFNITVIYDNLNHNGQMQIDLKSSAIPVACYGTIDYDNDAASLVAVMVIYDSLILLICILSIVLCVRSVYKAQKLRRETVNFFKNVQGSPLNFHDKMEFVNLWYVMIIVNDLMIVVGSVLKVRIELKTSPDYEMCGILLGTGNLLVWFGVLRYLKFFDTYNILILTMKKSAPNILRFLVCASVFYFGFTMCGWVVLGPYHIKFRYVSTASECLFSLINGDDMFVTFQAITSSGYIWWYSQIFLYGFISLFIYVILSVFLSVILDTYETIKGYYENGFPKTELHEFIDGESESGTFTNYGTPGCCAVLSLACMKRCCQRTEEQTPLSIQSDEMETSVPT